MKINNITDTETIVSNSYGKDRLENNEEQEKQGGKESKNIKASELNLFQDEIAEKKQKAMQEAMDFIKKQFESDGMLDDTVEECRTQMEESKEKAQEASREMGAIREETEQLKEECPDENSEEYRERLKGLEERKAHWQKQWNEAHLDIAGQTAAIKAVKQEALKHHGMVDAVKAAEKTMQTASKEVVGLLMDEAKEKVEQDLEETVEKAEEGKEEKAEREEALKEAQAEQEEQLQKIKEQQEEREKRKSMEAGVMQMPKFISKQQEIVRNTKEILEEQKLLEEEIKGIVVDCNL